MLKIAVVGAGGMGNVHAARYTRMAEAQLVGIVDARPEAAMECAVKSNTHAYVSLEELMEHEDPDVIDVCLPTYLHREFVEKAAAFGKHVICEKPLARTLVDAEAMMEACDSAGVQLFVGHVLRFFPEYQKVYDLVQNGTIGTVGTVRAFRGGGFPSSAGWYGSVERSGSVVMDLAIHDFDFLRWCFGKVQRVFAKSMLGRGFDNMDHCLVSLRFENGIIAHVEGSWAYPDGFRTELEVAGTQGIIKHDSDSAVSFRSHLRPTTSGQASISRSAAPLQKDPYQLELEHFLACIEQGIQPLVSAEDGYRAVEISLAALRSIETGNVATI